MRPTIAEQLSSRPVEETGAYLAMTETVEDLFAGRFNRPGQALEQVLTITQAGIQVLDIVIDRKVRGWFHQE